MIYYFSGCGNSKYVALELAKNVGDKLVFIPDAMKNGDFECNLKNNEMLGFVFPVYCWAPPQLVLDFISRLKINKTTVYTYFITTYGDNAGHTEKVFRAALKKHNIELSACLGIQMPETYVNMSGMDVDTKEVALQKINRAKDQLPELFETIADRRYLSDLEVGKNPFLKTYIVRPLFYKFLVTDKKWWTTNDCIGCGSCVSVCPLENISLNDNRRPEWKGNCTTCEACYHICPVHAIQFGKATKGKGQYKRFC